MTNSIKLNSENEKKELKELMIKIANCLGDNWIFNEKQTNEYKSSLYVLTNGYHSHIQIELRGDLLNFKLFIVSSCSTQKDRENKRAFSFFNECNITTKKSNYFICNELKKSLFINNKGYFYKSVIDKNIMQEKEKVIF